MWPIMGAISDERSMPPFMVAAYMGPGHPPYADDFLNDFAVEITNLNKDGILTGEVQKQFKCRLVTCDAPAKAFVKQIKGHNAFKGCNECDQTGFIMDHTTVFFH